MGRQFMLVDMRVGLILAFALALVQTSNTLSPSSDKQLDEASGRQEYRHRSINVHRRSVLGNSPIASSYKDCMDAIKDKSARVVIMCIVRSINTHQSAKKRGSKKSNLVFNAAKHVVFSPSADLSVHKPLDSHLDSISEISIPQYDFLDYGISSVNNLPVQKIHQIKQNMAKPPSLHNMKMMPFDFLTPPPSNTNGMSEEDTSEMTQPDYEMSSSDEYSDQRNHQPKPPSLHDMKMMPFDLLTPPPGHHGRKSHEKVSEMKTPSDHDGHQEPIISEKSIAGSQRGGSHLMPTFHHPMMPPLPSVTVKVMSSSEKQPIFVTNVYAPPMVDVFRILSEANFKWSKKHADERNLHPDLLTAYSADDGCVVLKEFAGVVTREDHTWEIVVEDIHGHEREAGVCIPSSNLHINPGNTIYVINKPRQQMDKQSPHRSIVATF